MKLQSSEPMEITSKIAAKCSGPDQFSKFDRLVKNVLAMPKVKADFFIKHGEHLKRPRRKKRG